jgi:hypothetical protein
MPAKGVSTIRGEVHPLMPTRIMLKANSVNSDLRKQYILPNRGFSWGSIPLAKQFFLNMMWQSIPLKL